MIGQTMAKGTALREARPSKAVNIYQSEAHMKTAKLFFLMMLMVFMAGASFSHAAAPQERTVVASGSGVDRGSAVKQALSEAVSMVTGLYVDISQITDMESEQRLGDAPSEQMTSRFHGRYSAIGRGHISSYNVLEEKKENGLYHVKLSVNVPVSVEDADGRKTIAISGIKLLGHARLEKPFAEKLRQDLNRRLLESREFCLLDRSSYSAGRVKGELDLSASSRARTSELRNMGKLYAARYLLFLAIHNFEVERWRGERDFVTRKRPRYADVRVTVSWQVVNSATGIICASGEVESAVEAVPVASSRDTAAVVRLAGVVSGKVQAQLARQAGRLK